MNLDIKFYWSLVLTRLPVMTGLFLVCFVTATVNALKLPPSYSTSAQLLVEEAQIPDSMIDSGGIDPVEQLQVIEERLMTRANKLDIARKFKVFEDVDLMSADEILEEMEENTDIRRTGGRRGEATLMRVSFEARSGQIAAAVVNEYITLILQENSDFRIGRAEAALAFFEQEVERLDLDLEVQSSEIIKFKNANSGALPDDLNFRQGRQTLLQERQARLERDIAAVEAQRRDLLTVYETTGQVDVEGNRTLSREEQQLLELQFELEQALAIYSGTNPRVTLLRNRIAQLERTIQNPSQGGSGLLVGEAQEPANVILELTMAEMEQRMLSYSEELQTVMDELNTLSVSIAATAGNAISLNALQRDYDNIQARYNEAVRNLNQARVNERIEVSAQGQRVSVIENASVPQEPSGPNRFLLIATGAAVGGALAAIYFMILETINRTVRRPAELQSRFNIIPLAVIPYIESRGELVRRRVALATAFLAVLIGVPAALYAIDTLYIPLDILANRIFDRLGFS